MTGKYHVTILVDCSDNGWTIPVRDALDFVEAKLALNISRQNPEWGAGRGAINYAKTEIIAVVPAPKQT